MQQPDCEMSSTGRPPTATDNRGSDTIIVCHREMKTLVKKMEQDILGTAGNSCRSKVDIRINAIEWNLFEDGYPNIFIKDVEDFTDKHVIFVGSFYSPGIIFEQISVLYALPKCSIRSLTFVLPYFNTGTMERVDTEGQVATAVAMARLLSAIPLSSMGPSRLLTFDIHALQERFYFSDNVIPKLASAMPKFIEIIRQLNTGIPISIAFPDEGAYNRFRVYFEDFPVVRCIKRRHGVEREVAIVDGNPENHHVIIVDDLINTGGTVQRCIACMKSAKAHTVSVFVTHAVFPNSSWKRFMKSPENEHVPDTFWITDSLPHAAEITKHDPFQLVSLSGSICSILKLC